MFIALFIFSRKTRVKVQVNPQPEVKPFDPSPNWYTGSQMHHSTLPYDPSAYNTLPSNSSIPPSFPSQHIPSDSSDSASGTQAMTTQLDIPVIHSPAPSHQRGMIAESPQLVAHSSSPNANGQLAAEQLVTLQTLYNLNMPPAEIAGVMERMRAGQQVPEMGSTNGLIRADVMRDPPRYDFKDA